MKIGEYLEQNKTELWNELIKHKLIDEHITIDNLDCKQTGCYEDKNDDLIETDEICSVIKGIDLSFDRKYVKAFEYDVSEFMIEVNGIEIYGLKYKCYR